MIEFKFKRGQLLLFVSTSTVYRIVDKKVDERYTIGDGRQSYKLKNVRREGRPGKGEMWRTETSILLSIERKDVMLIGNNAEMAKILYGKL